MNCTIANVDWCWVGKTLFLNKWLWIGGSILIPSILYIKYRWQIRAWRIRKINPKHVLTAIFLNKEGCISILPQKIEQQQIFNYTNETYMINKKATWRKYNFKESISDITKEIDEYVKIYKLPINNKLSQIATKLRILEEYSITEKGIFHTYHGKKWFWRKESTGEPYSLYIDGVPTPINRDYLLETNKRNSKVKWDSEVINLLAHQNFLKQFMTDNRIKMDLKTIMMLIGVMVIGIAIFWYFKNGGTLT